MWIPGDKWAALQRELGTLAAQLATAERRLAALEAERRAPVAVDAPAPAPDTPPTADDVDGLTPALREAIRDFAGDEAAVARHLANEARRRLLRIRRLPAREQAQAITDLAAQLREGETYTGRIPL